MVINQMQKTNSGVEEEGQITSVYEETMGVLNKRTQFFPKNYVSHESELLKENLPVPRSITQIFPMLGSYSVGESPVQPELRDLYTSQYDRVQPRCILPPHSDGEQSVNYQECPDPSFRWLASALIDSTRLNTDQIEAKKVERGKTLPEWQNVNQLLLFNMMKKIHIRSHAKSIQKQLHSTFSKYPWVRIKHIKYIYYKGKACALLRFLDGTSFAYYNLTKNQNMRKDCFGANCEVLRVVENRLKLAQHDRWIGLIFRGLPPQLARDNFLAILKKNNLVPVWAEELIQIQNQKVTLCTVNYIQEAFEFCQVFQVNSPFKDAKVNLHPRSKKVWRSNSQELLT